MWTSEINNKFLLVQQSAIIKNIVYEILRECDKRDFVCEKKFVTFLVHLISLQFKDKIDFNEKFDRKSIEELIGICLKNIVGESNSLCVCLSHFHHNVLYLSFSTDLNETPMNITLKMQVFFIEHSSPYEDIINEYHENLNKKTGMLVKEIVEGTNTKSREELAVLHKKIVVDIVLQTALGSPSNHEVRELKEKRL
jgi:hypothetical protein